MMSENINIQLNDGQQFAKDDYDNKTVYGYEKNNFKDLENIIRNY